MKLCDMSATGAHGGRAASSIRSRALATVSTASVLAALSFSPHGAYAQSEPAQPQAAQAPVEEVVVTGSRIVRNGYEAPTPLTVIGAEQLQEAAPANIADYVNQLPSLAGSATPQNSQKSVSGGTAGLNNLNLRDLGSTRTLVLLDGQRSVGSLITGQVDVDNMPQGLISRVDVVTGGASAAYGSDALSGVVNFVLDKGFTGLKGEVSGGVTTYGDDRNWMITMTGGTGFANDRGHFLISADATNNDGVLRENRPWAQSGGHIILNPAYTATNGQPAYLIYSGVGLDDMSPGGIITAGPLKGIEFGPGGVPRQFNYGSIVSDPYMVGGDWQETNPAYFSSLDAQTNRQSLFTRAAYDITDNVNAFVQVSWNRTYALEYDAQQYQPGNLSIKADNAFIPASVAAQVTALKLTSLTIGTNNVDLGPFGTSNNRITDRYVFGGDGKFDAVGTTWSWDTYYQKGETRVSNNIVDTTLKSNYALAIDAVRNPATGAIVCRSTLTSPTNGCVPYNVFGIGVNSQAAINYISQTQPHRDEDYKEDVESFNVRGEPFSIWAGAVSIAAGVEHRRESVYGVASAQDIANNYFVGNFLGNIGHYEVTEGYVETVVPLAKDVPWAKSLDLNAAVRATDYSVSGYVTTWKVGATYAPVDDVHFRATRSRDIRAPNLSELFAAGTSNTNNVNDPFNGNAPTQYQGFAVGNLELKPEEADTTGLGVVVQPSFIPGLSGSVDYYDINIGNAIGTVGAQDIVNFCFQGQQQFCDAITRGLNGSGVSVITRIRTSAFNEVQQKASGIDFEGSYHTALDNVVSSWNGDVTFRILATRYLTNYTNNGIPGVAATDTVGSNSANGPPTWRYLATLDYNLDPIDVTFTGRGVSSGTYMNSWITCSSGCPTATTNNETVNNNHIAGALYVDVNLVYKFMHHDQEGLDSEVYLNVKNIANKAPAFVAQGPSGTSYTAAADNPTLYDVLGRVFRLGVRFKM